MQETIVTELLDAQREIEEIKGRAISDSEFAKAYLPFSASSWSRLKAGTYGAGTERLLVRAAQALEEMPGRIEALRAAKAADGTFIRTTLAKAVLASVQAAKDSGNRRVVPVLAPTGFGKSCIGDYYVSRGAIYVHGRHAWQSSYKAFCMDVANACGPALPRSTSQSDAELEMVRRLRVKGGGVLFLDEANAVGPGFANGVKLIHNQTTFVVVVAAVPGPWDAFVRRAEEEVRQVVNRCQPVIRATRIAAADALPFLSTCGLDRATLDKAIPRALEVANALGGFKVLVSIADAVRATDAPTLADAEAAIDAERRNIVASGIPAKGGM